MFEVSLLYVVSPVSEQNFLKGQGSQLSGRTPLSMRKVLGLIPGTVPKPNNTNKTQTPLSMRKALGLIPGTVPNPNNTNKTQTNK